MAVTVADIRAYGATEASSDNTTAFALAVAAIPNNTGGIVYVPKGTWKGRFVLKPTVTLRGAGDPATIIKLPDGANADVITKVSGQGQFIKIENLRVDGNRANNTTGSGIVLDTLFVTSGLDHVTVQECSENGVRITDSDEFLMSDVWIGNCDDTGLYMEDCHEVRMSAVASERAGDPCMEFVTSDHIVAVHLGTEQTSGSNKKGIVFDSCINVVLNLVFAYGGNTPGVHDTGLEWNSATTPGRASRLFVAGLSTGGYVNSFHDVVNTITETADSVMFYTDNMTPLTQTIRNGVLNLVSSGTKIAGASNGTLSINANNAKSGDLNLYFGGASPLIEFTSTQRIQFNNNDTYLNRVAAGMLGTGGGMVVGSAALATNATTGFLYIPTCAGTPTGTPVARTGTVPLVWDSTNKKFYVYDGSSWIGGTAPGVFS